MIGQFGVGFYSSYLVANTVQVTSKNNDDEQYIWTSTADSKFSIAKDPRGNTLGRGTRVTLHLKDDALEFVEQEKIKNLVKRYSEFINYPIKLYVSKDVQKEVPEESESPKKEGVTVTKGDGETAEEPKGDEEKKPEDAKKDDDVEVKDEGEKKEEDKPKMKTVTEQEWSWDHINEIKAIWMRPKEELTEDMYNSFYKTITKDSTDPLAYTHFSAEGEIEFKAILYIPKAAPYDLFEHYYGRSSALKLYVRRVLITEEFEDLMPKYLNFVKGVVDSDDLPLNVSREQLQQMKMVKVMSKKLVRKAIEMVRSMAEEEEEDDDDEYDEDAEEKKEGEEKDSEDKDDDKEKDDESKDKKDAAKEEDDSEDKYGTFWQHFGKNIKLGVIEDASNRNKLAKLLRFYSTHDTEALTNLDEYISRMKPDQDTILYLPGDSKEAILKSPILKKYQKKGYEVLLMADPIDEFCTQHLSEYEKRKVKSIAKDDVSLIDQGDEQAKKKL
jgi:heat shock protein beta